MLTGNQYAPQDFENAKNEPIILAPQDTQQQQQQWLAPHFVWAVRDELANKLCAGADDVPELERGGLKIITTLDWNAPAGRREMGRPQACSCPTSQIPRRSPHRSACPSSRG